MTPFSPLTEVYLLSNVPISPEHQRDFSDTNSQTNYFMRFNVIPAFTALTYQREHLYFKAPVRYDDVQQCNYIMYCNKNYTGKWYYGFITRKEYIAADNEQGVTAIYFEIDPFQTYMFNYTIKSAFIERQHLPRYDSDGQPIFYTYPEGLEMGSEYRTVFSSYHTEWDENNVILITSLYDFETSQLATDSPEIIYGGGGVYDKLPSAVKFYVATFKDSNVSSSFSSLMEYLSKAPWVAQCIQSITVLPKDISNNIASTSINFFSSGLKIGKVNQNQTVSDLYESYSFSQLMPSYSEVKLYSYPYTVIEITNHAGSTVTLHPENIFDKNLVTGGLTATFTKSFCLSATPRYVMYPQGYATSRKSGSKTQVPSGYDYACIIGSFPQFPVPIDNYLATIQSTNQSFQNALSVNDLQSNLSYINSAVSMGNAIPQSMNMGGNESAVVAKGVGMAAGIGSTVMSMINNYASHEIKEQSLLIQRQELKFNSPSLNGQINGDMLALKRNIFGFDIQVKTVMPEYANKLSSFFNCRGYLYNQQGIPNTKSRALWNYIRCSDMVIVGNIPEEHMTTLKSMYEKGITIWHDNDIGNYERDNNEV